ncbi:MAG: transporter [Candidatus Margulisiibacteriota bacterium]
MKYPLFVTPLLCLSLLAFPLNARELDPIETDRPDYTESATTVPKGYWQFENGYTFGKDGDTTVHTLGEALIRLGLNDGLEARFGLNSYHIESDTTTSTQGLEDIFVGIKWQWLSQNSNIPGQPDLSVMLHCFLPTGAESFRSQTLRPQAKLAASWDLNDRWSLGTNQNFTLLYDGSTSFWQYSPSCVLGYSWTDQLSSYTELYGFFPTDTTGGQTHYFNAGLAYQFSPDFQVDTRIGLGLNGKPNDYFVGIGSGIRFGH